MAILQQTTLNVFCQKIETYDKKSKHCGKRRNYTLCAISSFVTMFSKSQIENLYNWMDNLWLKVENIVAKGVFFCHYVFKKPSAAEASESVYMRERVMYYLIIVYFRHNSIKLYLGDSVCGSSGSVAGRPISKMTSDP